MFESLTIPSPKRNSKLQIGWEGFFPYYAGFPESFADAVLSTAGVSTNSVILDPWNGSGTTTYVATSRGIASIGIDLNPAMIIVAKARVLSPSEADSIQPLGREILKSAAEDNQPIDPTDPLTFWFSNNTARSLRSIESSIRRHLLGSLTLTSGAINLDRLSGLAATYYVALFSVCRQLTKRYRSTNPTWLRRPKANESKVRSRQASIERRFTSRLCSMAEALSTRTNATSSEQTMSELRVADTSASILLDDSIDLILTSPPYCTRIDYTAATRIELAALHPLLSETYDTLARQMTGTTKIANHHIDAAANWGPTCSAFLHSLKAHQSKASSGYYYKTHLDYFDKMSRSLAHCAKALRTGGAAIIVIQDSYYKDIHNDLPTIISEMALAHSLKLKRREDFYFSRSMSGLNPRARAYGRRSGAVESVLCLQKELTTRRNPVRSGRSQRSANGAAA
ncbi:MAG TPA: DNA methyltransferase [Candidatus Acidoferrales bacterium]|nr:DNA methyltransferase [Candidatus Acidoferrales bacterium]